MTRVLIAGIDGYLGWPLAQYLTARGHEVSGIDAGFRREWVAEMGGRSALPVASVEARLDAFEAAYGRRPHLVQGDLTDRNVVYRLFEDVRPEVIVHLGECPSAPYSMMDADHAIWVQRNNIEGTMNVLYAMRDQAPEAHLVKLGTMGEYGTPNLDIPEGFFEVEYRGRRDRLPFPRQAGSWYHWSKVHDSNNVMFACRIFGLRATDVMQGVVYGTRFFGSASDHPADPALHTRLDFDQAFGTALNRFCCQSVIGEPLTLFGLGNQRRGFLPICDSMQCLTLAVDNPPEAGDYRVFNQFEETYTISELAAKVAAVASDMGLEPRIRRIENPRKELEEHHYNPDHDHLPALGYQPTRDMDSELRAMLEDLLPHHDRIAAKRDVLLPDIRWDGSRRRSAFLDKSTSLDAGNGAGSGSATETPDHDQPGKVEPMIDPVLAGTR
ncbi:MAG: NAD-dependent epimerase/dehydratase family protein [Holophagales bacterium]|nr:NAD-dependent epimerase/dehydratase family protein [Holophagales bacterium]MYH26621.1 NAD-dependent epimerase/dehydratase family protein [Holophagales bacterium]